MYAALMAGFIAVNAAIAVGSAGFAAAWAYRQPELFDTLPPEAQEVMRSAGMGRL